MRREHRRIRGPRTSLTWLAACAAGAAAFATPSRASAQSSDTAPRPNVLVILDTSGSMELMMDGTSPDTTGSAGQCPTDYSTLATAPNITRNRWAAQLEAITGTFTAYSCIDMSRAYNSAFDQEFSYWAGSPPDMNNGKGGSSQTHPYDLDYYLDFHRPAYPLTDSTGKPTGIVCAYGFDQSSTGWSTSSAVSHTPNDFTAASLGWYQYYGGAPAATSTSLIGQPVLSGGKLQACSASNFQSPTGLLDQAGSAIRFSVMSIDSDTNQRIGATVTAGGTSSELFQCLASSTGTTPDPPTIDLTTGMWSYFYGWDGSQAASQGRPTGCTTNPVPYYEVGARNPVAPPWEGPLVRFPTATTSDPDPDPSGTNNLVRQAVLAMRPYGANPIAGLLDDAKYYYWADPLGPSGTGIDALAGCRKNYIILLTHAAPNLDLATNIDSSATCRATSQPSADAGGGSGANGQCPYDFPEAIAQGLSTGTYTPTSNANLGSSAATTTVTNGNKVITFVVGFSLQSFTSGSNDAGSTESCNDVLIPAGTTPPTYTGVDTTKCGTTGVSSTSFLTTHPEYQTCCDLAKVATAGGSTVPYFADNQQDLNSAFAAILAIVRQSETTRAPPVTMPQTANTLYADGTQHGAMTAEFISSFEPETVRTWNGDVQRQRYQCTQGAGGAWQQQGLTIDTNAGDDFATNIDQSPGVTRHVMVVSPTVDVHTNPKNGATSNLRMWVAGSTSNTGTALDNLDMADGVELMTSYTESGSGASSILSQVAANSGGLPPEALFGTGGTCPVNNPQTQQPFSLADCHTITFDWLLGASSGPTSWPTTFESFPARYWTGNNLTSAMGGVLHSTPAIATPPFALLQDDSFQAYVNFYAKNFCSTTTTPSCTSPEPRHTMLYVATVDGLLHAFGIDYDANDNYTFNGTNTTSQKMNELWTFVPPAVMPNLLTGFPKGQSTLLDGPPVVKETVYQRSQVNTGYDDWHTTLVAGFGPSPTTSTGGYYALDVTDPEAADHASSPGVHGTHTTINATGGTSAMPYMSTTASRHTQGPHFLWQLTGSDPDSKTGFALGHVFGKYGATPAITTVVIDDGDGNGKHEVGVAILPGGTDYTSPITSGSTTTSCTRQTHTINALPDTGYAMATNVRNWANDPNAPDCFVNPNSKATPAVNTQPVAGRTLMVVRLDTGEVIRLFANLSGPDLVDPSTAKNYTTTQFPLFGATKVGGTNPSFTTLGRVTDAKFDSPITGTPVPYPNDIGAIAQRIFVGDQDGTIWRLDVSNTDPGQWFVEPFFDSFNQTVQAAPGPHAPTGSSNATTWATAMRPVVDQPRVSLGRSGSVTLDYGTGDLTSLGTNDGSQNYVFSLAETASTSQSQKLVAKVNWWEALPSAGEMVSGPSVVFDSVFYYATFVPPTASGKTCSVGEAWLWGVDYETPTDSSFSTTPTQPVTPPSNGGIPEIVVGSGSNAQVKQSVDTGQTTVMPGVAVTSTAACATTTSIPDPYMGGNRADLQNLQPAQYSVQGLLAKPNTGGSTPTNANVQQYNYSIANGPRATTLVDSWAAIVE